MLTPRLLAGLLATALAVPALAQGPAPDPAAPTGIWVLARDPIELDADVLDALAPDCTTTQGVNPSGALVFSVACAGYAAQVYPQFVRPEQMESFRRTMLESVPPGHAVAGHVKAMSQVINVFLPAGLDRDGHARDLVRAIARKTHGLVYAWRSVYEVDGTRLLGAGPAPESF